MSRIYSARVRGGRVVLDDVNLPDGAVVTVAVNDDREVEGEVEPTPAELAELDKAVAEADADENEPLSSDFVLAHLAQISRAAR
jgi:hypothetical protein